MLPVVGMIEHALHEPDDGSLNLTTECVGDAQLVIAANLAHLIEKGRVGSERRLIQQRVHQVPSLLARLAADTGYWTVLILGFISGFGTMGVNVAGLVAGVGLTGFALGFALRDAVSNLLAGVLILTFRPFRVGSDIKVGGFSGTVLAIDLRYTTLSGEGRYVLVPNKTMYTSPITVIGGAAEAAPEGGKGPASGDQSP